MPSKTLAIVLGLALVLGWGAVYVNAQGQEQALTVGDLINNPSKYASKIVVVRGELIPDYHGKALCDKKVRPCVYITNTPDSIYPKPNFEVEKDSLYWDYERLVMEQLGGRNTELILTLRGRFDIPPKGSNSLKELVLQKVIALEVRKKPPEILADPPVFRFDK